MIPDGWKVKPLGEVVRVQGGNAFKSALFGANGIPVVRISSIKDSAVSLIDAPLHPYHANLARFELTDGDLLIAMSGATTGKLGRYRKSSPAERAYLNQRVGRFLPTSGDQRDLDFCWYVLQTENVQAAIIGDSIGGAQPNVSGAEIERVLVKVPPPAERWQIAEALSTWDRAIETVEALITNARTQKQALMQSLLTGKKRLPGFSGAWHWITFSDVFDRVREKNAVGNTNVLTISAQHGLISQMEYFNKSVASEDVRGYTLLRRGDFAYNKSYSDGYPMGAFKPLERYDSGIVSSLYICFRLTSDDHDHAFFRHYFEAGLFNQEVSAIAQEGARNHGLLNVSVVDFFDTSVHAPSREEQVAIAQVINQAEKTERALEAQLAALRREKSGLMQQLLTGKRRVKVGADIDA